jgi:SAM-dependent methyltransferase
LLRIVQAKIRLIADFVIYFPATKHSTQLSNELSKLIVGNHNHNKVNQRNGFRVVDLCCGVGFSTRALRDAFHQPETTVIGVDTSPEMVRVFFLHVLYVGPCFIYHTVPSITSLLTPFH